jgi:hypothetical protein
MDRHDLKAQPPLTPAIPPYDGVIGLPRIFSSTQNCQTEIQKMAK